MSLGLGSIAPTKNTAELIADALRSAILQGKLHSGQALRQDEIASEFSVSKIPVREALFLLQAEGLVSMLPSRGAIVSHLTLEDISEIYTIRLSLEPIALARSVPEYNDADFAQVESILSQIDHESDLTKWAELNWAFHAALYAPAQMPRLTQITRMLHNNVARYLLKHYLDHEYLAVSQAQHREIVALCKRRDIDGAVAALRLHLHDPVDVIRLSSDPG